MAIVFDSASFGEGLNTDLSWTHTVTDSGSDRIIIVSIGIRNASGNPNPSINGVTYAGESFTLIASDSRETASDNEIFGWMYYLVNPKTGANTVEVDANFAAAGQNIVAIAASYTGIDVNDPIGTPASIDRALTDNDLSVTVTSAENELVVDMFTALYVSGDAEPTTTAQIERYEEEYGSGGASIHVNISDQVGASSVDMSWSFTQVNTNYPEVLIAVPLKPSTDIKTPLVEILNNAYMDRFAGRTKILSTSGEDLLLEQIPTNSWAYFDGPNFPNTNRPDNLTQDGIAAFIESVSVKGDIATITAQSENFLTNILSRLARG